MFLKIIQHDKDNKTAQWVVFAVFVFALLYFKFSFHELWKDEWQAWLVARDRTWIGLFDFLYYEGHPALWYLYLKIWAPLASFVNEAFLLQLAHSLPVIISAFLLIFRFNFSILFKAGLLFSYFFFFEYGIVNRGYTLVILLSFVAGLLMRDPRENYLWLAVVIFLLCQTEVYGLLIGGALFFYLLLSTYYRKEQFLSLWRSMPLNLTALVLLAGVVVFAFTVYPRAEQSDLSRAYLQDPFSKEVCAKAFQGSLANTYAIGLLPDTNQSGASTMGIILSILILAWLITLFWSDKKVLYTFLVFFLVLQLFQMSIYTGGLRQWGMGFIFFIVCLQLLSYRNTELRKDHMAVLWLILLAQVVHNGRAVYKDFHSPFSNAIYAGAFIKKNVSELTPVVAIDKFEVSPVGAYAGRAFFELPDGKPFTYFRWLEKVYLPPQSELKLFAQYKKSPTLVVVAPNPLDARRYPQAKLWKAFDRYSFKNEQYFVYLFEWKK